MARADKQQPLTRRFGAYEIIRPLARGGMAELFLVRVSGPEGFEKVLVLKRILPHFAENPRFVRAFLDEAKLVAGFDHPHIAHVHDMGTADGSYFFTMEFVHGVDLRTMLKRYKREATPLPIALAVLIARNIASALYYAHERRGPDGKSMNVVHRDVSPSNIIVSFDGVPKLVDFGIAKATSSTMKTQTGALKGKIAYMSPEQAKGAPIDRRTDIYALGIILWEMIANRRLYKGDNDMATIQRIIYEPAQSPRTHRPDCPVELERIVARALSLDVDVRYQTAEQLQTELEDFALEHKLKQSAVLLRDELERAFSLELKVWEEAQAGTATMTDGIATPPEDPTTRRFALPMQIGDDDEEDSEGERDDATPDRPPVTAASNRALPIAVVPFTAPELPRPSIEPPALAPVPVPVPVPALRGKRTWLLLGVAAVAASTLAIVIGFTNTDVDHQPVAAPVREPTVVPIPTVMPVPVPLVTPDAMIESAAATKPAEIEMPVVVVKEPWKPEIKRVKKAAPKPKIEQPTKPKPQPRPDLKETEAPAKSKPQPKPDLKETEPPAKPKPPTKHDPNAVFPPAS